jgi:hypothetical protein
MLFLVDLARSEITKIMQDENTSERQKLKIKGIQIIKVSNISSLQRAVSTHKDVLLTILDCNAPDAKGGAPHDQLIKNHIVTGQHKAVDIVTKYIQNTPITLISSLHRFHRTVNRYYEKKYNLRIKLCVKMNQLGSKKISRYLNEYLS